MFIILIWVSNFLLRNPLIAISYKLNNILSFSNIDNNCIILLSYLKLIRNKDLHIIFYEIETFRKCFYVKLLQREKCDILRREDCIYLTRERW